jgi:hypothetical protein
MHRLFHLHVVKALRVGLSTYILPFDRCVCPHPARQQADEHFHRQAPAVPNVSFA